MLKCLKIQQIKTARRQFSLSCIDFAGETSYETLKGNWKRGLPHAVVHRMAVYEAYRGQGIASIAFQLTEKRCIQKGIYSVWADTDENNAMMRHVLAKNGFEYCGTIWFDNSVKYAYEKILKGEVSVNGAV